MNEGTLSEGLWGIDFRAHFPLVVRSGPSTIVTADVVTVDELDRFTGERYRSLFGVGDDSQFWRAAPSAARRQYLRRACDLFLFRDGPDPVGLFVGNPLDWSSYYIRSTAFLPEYRGNALYQGFLAHAFEVLRAAGVARIEAETAPSNLACVAALLRQGFFASGSVLSEQWGACTRFTKHLDLDAQSVFLDRFCRAGSGHVRTPRRGPLHSKSPRAPSDSMSVPPITTFRERREE